jgi:ribonucleoside-diphosphate reductase alpha chain
MNTLKDKSNTDDFSLIEADPEWVINNPYLDILAPRFFSEGKNYDWSDLPKRVGKLFLKAEEKYSNTVVAQQRAREVMKLVSDGTFLPNSPVMMNSEGDGNVNLFACHVLSPPSNFDDLNIAKKIHDGCGGIGYDFSQLGDPVSATISIEKQTENLNPNRKRKAHSAVTLSYLHPMIYDFIKVSQDLTITHTNVEFDDDFFDKLRDNDTGSKALWDILCESIHRTGRPSLSFSSEKNKRSNTKLINNVCGESLLRENESSLIGSINLTKFVRNSVFDFERFEKTARIALRCLDNLHDIQDHASIVVQERCFESRKVGVGVMGYSDTLLLLNLRYGSDESLEFIEKLMSLLKSSLLNESEKLGQERGFCNASLLANGATPRRNASLMAIPANGTLSLLANVSGGIEPVFSYLIKQNVQGVIVRQLQPTFKYLLCKNKIDHNFIYAELILGKELDSIDCIDKDMKHVLVTANELTTEEHILTQSKFQSFIDGGISKTINLPNFATTDSIKDAILLAKEKGCVGISLYRNGSIQDQPTQSVK